jgi:hypothetical protein
MENGEKWDRQRRRNDGADDWRMGGGDMVVNGMCLGGEMVGILEKNGEDKRRELYIVDEKMRGRREESDLKRVT